mmetsp:Transcript_2020/g.5062  ORF Transcript_2020/g.5062 Transcript_2020/m.5062 type:complete len:200 (+) Transcript_2020:912-1511(+)
MGPITLDTCVRQTWYAVLLAGVVPDRTLALVAPIVNAGVTPCLAHPCVRSYGHRPRAGTNKPASRRKDQAADLCVGHCGRRMSQARPPSSTQLELASSCLELPSGCLEPAGQLARFLSSASTLVAHWPCLGPTALWGPPAVLRSPRASCPGPAPSLPPAVPGRPPAALMSRPPAALSRAMLSWLALSRAAAPPAGLQLP